LPPLSNARLLTATQPTPRILTPARRRTRATSSRNPGRDHLGVPRRLRRNPHFKYSTRGRGNNLGFGSAGRSPPALARSRLDGRRPKQSRAINYEDGSGFASPGARHRAGIPRPGDFTRRRVQCGSDTPVPRHRSERPEPAQPRRCPAFRRRSLDRPICRLSPLCGASQWFAELTIYALVSRLSASCMEAITASKIPIRSRWCSGRGDLRCPCLANTAACG